MFTDWSGPRHRVKKFGTQHRRIDALPGLLDPPKVMNNHIQDGERLVELEVRGQDGNREVMP